MGGTKMLIRKIRISNFKSFKNLEVDLGSFSVLIGANASGKSNFIQIFKFIRDITIHGLDNAISMQGGIEYLRNINIGSSENLSLEIISNVEYGRAIGRIKRREPLAMKVYETIYSFALKFKRKGLGYEIAKDELTQKFDIVELNLKKKALKERKKLGSGEITISNVKGRIKTENLIIQEDLNLKEEDIFPRFLKAERLAPRSLFLEARPFIIFPRFPPIFISISIYDFDPKLPKKASPITGKAEIEEDGSNLAIVLKNIIENKDKKTKLSNLVKELLPFVDDLSVEKFADKSLLFKLKEIYSRNQYLPASLISDGTISMTALIVALYFDNKELTIIEEPERNIHPYLISKVINMMKEASETKQIIVTTHNPEIVKYAGLENLLLISRDKDGFSIISKPYENEAVRTFLKNELGIEELYIQNLLKL